MAARFSRERSLSSCSMDTSSSSEAPESPQATEQEAGEAPAATPHQQPHHNHDAPWHYAGELNLDPGRRHVLSSEVRRGMLLYLPDRHRTVPSQDRNIEPVTTVDGWRPRLQVYGHYIIIISRPKANPEKVTFVTVCNVLLASYKKEMLTFLPPAHISYW